ncbi:hypothetical protein B0H10DRAFT_1990267 [Mycena sp. CBHHK59/15]|nr:hypothetical protein B0H10DRAFT_1990267 [Mycena sp. CBHHK59/15]
MRALKEDRREVFELLSDSEPDVDDPDSDLEVIDTLKPTSRSSSAIPPLSNANDAHDNDSEVEEPGAAPETTSPSSNVDEDCVDSELLESDMVWQDDGTSHVRIGPFRPTRKVTVERMEYREGLPPFIPYTAFALESSLTSVMRNTDSGTPPPKSSSRSRLSFRMRTMTCGSWAAVAVVPNSCLRPGRSLPTADVPTRPVKVLTHVSSLILPFETQSVSNWIQHHTTQ